MQGGGGGGGVGVGRGGADGHRHMQGGGDSCPTRRGATEERPRGAATAQWKGRGADGDDASSLSSS